MSLSTPVAFLIFNRPDLTRTVFQAIAEAKPKTLLVVADGPRFPEEAEKCKKARTVVLSGVDWDCRVSTNFADSNLGCKVRPSSGLGWVFSQVDEAIILEDDCVPAPSFFYFCQSLLEHYRDDERIMGIGGCNFQLGQKRTDCSYYFSKYPHTWGWATWKRAWRYFDENIVACPELKRAGILNWLCDDPCERRYWTNIFDQLVEGRINTWDYQWLFAMWCQNGLSVVPSENLVSNIGFGPDATHTRSDNLMARLPTKDVWEIRHPSFVVRHKEADKYEFDYAFGGRKLRGVYGALRVIRRFLRSKQGSCVLLM